MNMMSVGCPPVAGKVARVTVWRVLVGSILPLMIALAGCTANDTEGEETLGEGEPEATSTDALSSVSCAASQARGYTNGTAEDITVVRIDGKPVERHTASAYYVMARAAERD